MSHQYFPLGKQSALALASGSGTAPTGTLKMALLRLDGTVSATHANTVTGATAATPIVLTTAIGNGAAVGDKIVVLGVGGTKGANGTYRASARDATHVTLQTLNGTNTTGVGAYTSGGFAINLSKMQYYSDISALVVGTPVALSSPTFTNGVLNNGAGAGVVHSNVPAGVVSAWCVYLDTGTASTSPLIFFSDSKQRIVAAAQAASSATSIITTGVEGTIPNNTVITWSNGIQSTLSAQATAGMDGVTLAVTALGSAIPAGCSADVEWSNSLLPNSSGSTYSLTINPDPGSTYTGEPVGFAEI